MAGFNGPGYSLLTGGELFVHVAAALQHCRPWHDIPFERGRSILDEKRSRRKYICSAVNPSNRADDHLPVRWADGQHVGSRILVTVLLLALVSPHLHFITSRNGLGRLAASALLSLGFLIAASWTAGFDRH